jgi:hypothetical protein
MVISTMVLSRLPSVLAWPWGPTPFWNPMNRSVPRRLRSSGSRSGSVSTTEDPMGQ